MTKKWWAMLLTSLLATATFAAPINDQDAGKTFMHLVRQRLPLVNDPISSDYINHLGYRLVAYSSEPSKPFHFFIIQENVINAFAGPGGYIGVYAGLILTTKNESELASVLAHEISHVTQHHLYRGADKMKRMSLPTLAAMVAGIAVGGPVGMAGLTSALAGDTQYNINTIRSYEKEADRIGIDTLHKAGFDSHAMPTFFERMQRASNDTGTIPPLLLTHPVTGDRIAEAENRAALYAHKKDNTTDTYYLVKARLQLLLSDEPAAFLRQTKTRYQNNPNNPYKQYIYALALLQNNQYATATQLLRTLMLTHPAQIIYPMTLAHAYTQSKAYDKALALLEKTYQYNSDYTPLVLQYASTLLTAKEAQQALTLLEDKQTSYQNNLAYWDLLSKAQAKCHQLSLAYMSRARAYELASNYKNALIQLELAKKQKDSSPYTQTMANDEIVRIKKILAEKNGL